jgi:hypothetical protein
VRHGDFRDLRVQVRVYTEMQGARSPSDILSRFSAKVGSLGKFWEAAAAERGMPTEVREPTVHGERI